MSKLPKSGVFKEQQKKKKKKAWEQRKLLATFVENKDIDDSI